MDKKSTGRVVVGAGAASISVYLMQGNVIAAESPDDPRMYAHLLRRQGIIDDAQAAKIEAHIEASEPVFGHIMDAAGAALDELLYQRFIQNLSDFTGSLSKPKFTKMPGVFVDNIQMGHATSELLDKCCMVWDRASSLDLDAVIQIGRTPLEQDQHFEVGKCLGSEKRTISSVLLDLSFEALASRILLLDMLAANMLNYAAPDTEESEAEEEEDVDDAPTEFAQAPIDIDSVPVAAKKVGSVPPEAALLPGAGQSSTPNSLDNWISQASVVDDDELDFFADHDFDRGDGDEGAFSTQSHNLDKVELFGGNDEPAAPPVPHIPQPVVEETPTSRFSAPVLTDDDARAKIQVANDELSKVVHAFDEAEGPGRGRAVVQLLVDGSPSKFAALLHHLQVADDGTLPADQVIENLAARPPTEHRQLMNQALIDVIDRALSSAADELPDELFDDMYEAIAGYRQRMGL